MYKKTAKKCRDNVGIIAGGLPLVVTRDDSTTKNSKKRQIHRGWVTRVTTPLDLGVGSKKYCILKLLHKSFSVREIAKKMSFSHVACLKHLSKLKNEGFCDVVLSCWKLTKKGDEILRSSIGNERVVTPIAGYDRVVTSTTQWLKDRVHNVKVKLLVVKKPLSNDWLKSWKPYKMKYNTFYVTQINDLSITFTGKSLIFQLPIFFTDTPAMIFDTIENMIKNEKVQIEKQAKGLVLGKVNIRQQIITQHHAFQNEPVSKACAKQGISLSGSGVDIDASDADTPELEFTSLNAHNEAQKYKEQVQDMVKIETPLISAVSNRCDRIEQHLDIITKHIETVVTVQEISIKELNVFIKALTPKTEEPSKEVFDKRDYFG